MLQRRVPTLYSGFSSPQKDFLPDNFIQEVRTRASIRDVIEPHVKLKKTGASLVGLCPFHNEKSPSFSVSEAKGFYHCFGCGEHGDAIAFLMRFAGQSFREAVEELAGASGMALPQGVSNRQVQNFDEIHKKLNLAHRFFRHCLKYTEEPKDYLKSRGVNAQTLADFPIGYAPKGWQSLSEAFGAQAYAEDPDLVNAALVREKDGRRYDVFRDRLMFAIRDTRGRVIGFGGRSMDGSTPKYLNSPESPVFDKGSILFGFHEARSAILAEKKVVVVEGYMDVVMLAQNDIKYVVATMGTACTPQQIERLCAIAPVTTFTFDGDAAGQRAAWRALERCLPYVKESHEFRFCILPEGTDPDELIQKEGTNAMRQRLDSAQGLPNFLMSELAKRHNNLDAPEDRARFLADGLEIIRNLPRGSAYYRTLRDDIGKASNAGAAYIANLRQFNRRSSHKTNIWGKLVEAVKRFPASAKNHVEEVVNALSEEDYEMLSKEVFSSEQEQEFWEEFLSLNEQDQLQEQPANEEIDMSKMDIINSLGTLVTNQLNKQKRLRLNGQYRKGELSEAEFIEARTARPSQAPT